MPPHTGKACEQHRWRQAQDRTAKTQGLEPPTAHLPTLTAQRTAKAGAAKPPPHSMGESIPPLPSKASDSCRNPATPRGHKNDRGADGDQPQEQREERTSATRGQAGLVKKRLKDNAQARGNTSWLEPSSQPYGRWIPCIVGHPRPAEHETKIYIPKYVCRGSGLIATTKFFRPTCRTRDAIMFCLNFYDCSFYHMSHMFSVGRWGGNIQILRYSA